MTSLNYASDAPIIEPNRTRRGEANALRKGTSKIHRRYQPGLRCAVPRGMASKVVARVSSHNWHRNPDLVELRQNGYVPYTKRNDPYYIPKPMRVHARSEACEALTALSQVMAANCDFNPDSDYPFEIMAPMEQLAHYMGVLHVYDSGRKAYDVALNALSVMEQLQYAIVLHGKDTDSGQNKPLRVWLSEKFFTSRGIAVDEIRQWLGQFRTWAIKNGLTETLRTKYERHLLRIEHIGIDIKNRHSLRNRLKQIKRWVVNPVLAREKEKVVGQLENDLDTLEQGDRLDLLLDGLQSKIKADGKGHKKAQNLMYQAYVAWSNKTMRHEVVQLEMALQRDNPGLLHSDPEAYYQRLLERAGIL
ncbi:Replication protein [Serratia sp. JSRIV002]|uniref:Replication protein n=1 Tax=Serratia sp. JSRIV002 TaxID=2831894 RepID=UPI0035301B6D